MDNGDKNQRLLEIHQSSAVGNFSKALEQCAQALLYHNEDAELLAYYGRLLCLNRRSAEAVAYFMQLIRTNPKEGAYHFGIGLALWDEGELASAEIALKSALSCEHRQPDAIVPLIHLLMKQGRWDEASGKVDEISKNEDEIAALSVEYHGLFLCRRAEIAFHHNQQTLGRAYLREAAALSVTPSSVWEILRSQNEKVDQRTKLYHLVVSGETYDPVPSLERVAPFVGRYDVVANDRREALCYVKEIEAIGNPETLVIEHAKKTHSLRGIGRRGVVFRYPSISMMEVPPSKH